MLSKFRPLNFFFALALFILTIQNQGYAQNSDPKVRKINEQVRKINQDSSFHIVILNNEEFLVEITDRGGQLKGYFKEDTLIKIVERIGLSYCTRENTYFFQENELIYVAQEENAFAYVDSIDGFDYSRFDLTFEGHYYFDNGKVIKSNLTGKKRIEDQMDTQAKARLLMNAAERNRSLLLQKFTSPTSDH